MKIKIIEIITFIFFVSTLLMVALPSGSILGFNIKILTYIILVFTFIIAVVYRKVKLPFNFTSIVIVAIAYVIIYSIYGFINYGKSAIVEAKLIIITITLIYLIYIFLSKIIDTSVFFKLYTTAIVLTFIIKTSAYIYGYTKGSNLFEVEEFARNFYSSIFDSNITSTRIHSAYLLRLNVQTDLLSAFYPLVLAWQSKSVSVLKASKIIIIIATFMVISSLSRYFTAIYFVGIMVLAYERKLLYTTLKYLFLVTILFLYFFHDEIMSVIKMRLASKSNDNSDKIRVIQQIALIDMIIKRPIFGHGIGSYNPTYIRSELIPFAYEKQILSFFMKIGISGIAFISIGVAYIYLKVKKNLIAVTSLILLFGVGLFNPQLYSSNIVLIYVFILLMSNKVNNSTVNLND